MFLFYQAQMPASSSERVRYKRPLAWVLLAIAVLFGNFQELSAAEQMQQDKLVKSLSFIYAPILGTGYYKAGAETALVLRVPANRLLSDDSGKAGPRVLLPITFGVRKTDFDAILEEGLPEKLHSLGIMPGLAWDFKPHPDWDIVPSLQLGFAHDFNTDTSATIYSANLRSLGQWVWKENTISWGARLRGAGQRVFNDNETQGFVLLETGLDWEFSPVIPIGDQRVKVSLYTQLQKYLPDLGVRGISGERIDVENLVHLGMGVHFKSPIKILGLPLKRLGFAIVRGDELEAISLNLGFPLFRD